MDEQDGLGTRPDELGSSRPAEVERVIDVGEDRSGARVHDGIGGGDESERARDHLVTRADAMRQERQEESGRAVAGRDSVRRAHGRRELAFKRADALTLGERARAQHLQHGRFLLGAKLRARERNHVSITLVVR